MVEESSNIEVFVYTEGAIVPEDVYSVRIHPSVTVIPEEAFYQRKKLEEIELCEGLLEIGKKAFLECDVLIRITIPSTVTIIHECAFEKCRRLSYVKFLQGGSLREIGDYAFNHCISLKSIRIRLPDSIEIIGNVAFNGCEIINFRTPSLMTTISSGMISNCMSLFSVELPENITRIGAYSFDGCTLLRNVAISFDTDVEEHTFDDCSDLDQLCDSEIHKVQTLKHRFHNLPIHKMIYYQSYNNVTVDQLNDATNVKISRSRSKPDPTGNLQDRLGMTPLHIMACSTVPNLELYKVLVTKYPENLITEDRWGALPLLYAVLINTPTRESSSEIVQFLVESYKSLFPNHRFNWNEMVLSLARFDTLVVWYACHDVIRYFCGIQQESFPDQHFDWDVVLEEAANRWDEDHPKHIPTLSFRHLVRLSSSAQANRMGFTKVLQYVRTMLDKVYTADISEGSQGRRDFIAEIQEHLVHCEEEYRALKEATTLLELALWKKKMDDHCQEANEKRRIKKMKIEESARRKMCRVGCGADIVIEHVLPFLVQM